MLTIAMLAGLGAAEAREVLIYNDNGYAWSEAAAVALGHTVRTVQGDWVPFQAAYATGVVDVLVIESAYGELPTQVVDVLQTHILAGKPYIVTHWGIDRDAQLRAITGVMSLRSYYQPEAVTSLAGADPFGLFVGVGEVAMSGDYVTDDGDYLTGGAVAGLTASGNAAIRFSRGGFVNGWQPINAQGVDADFDGMADAAEVLANELAYLTALDGPTLVVGGSCPGAVTIAGARLTPGGSVAVLRADGAGSTVVPSGACAGLRLGLGSAGLGLVTIGVADAAGELSYAGPVLPGLCGRSLQLVDLASCEASGVGGL